MRVLTIRLPDDQPERLKTLAAQRGSSLNKLFEEFSTKAIAEFDTENRFRVRAARGIRRGGWRYGLGWSGSLRGRSHKRSVKVRDSLHVVIPNRAAISGSHSGAERKSFILNQFLTAAVEENIPDCAAWRR